MVQELGPVNFFQNFDLGKASTGSVRSYQHQCAQFHPYGSRVVGNFYNMDLGKASTNEKVIFWARSCQYQCVWKISLKYSTCLKR